MSLDEALLETVRLEPQPVLIVRTYQWETQTLSLGANQQVKGLHFLLSLYGGDAQTTSVVRRPTGGRAIMHGQDISFAFITNDPLVLRQSLKHAYALYAALVQSSLNSLALETRFADSDDSKAYIRSPACFETHTPSDLLDRQGKKLMGSAQLRRSGGLLQHGAAFLEPWGVSEETFSHALFDAVKSRFVQGSITDYPAEALKTIEPLRLKLESDYIRASEVILDKASTTTGSHLEPASF